jgi:hypothetical protein
LTSAAQQTSLYDHDKQRMQETWMRTTWNVDDEVVEEVKRFALARSIPAGEAASLLIRRGLKTRLGMRLEQGVPVFDVPEDSPIVTLDHVQRLIDEL